MLGKLQLAFVLLVFITVACGESFALDAEVTQRPNILFMLSDDQAWNGLSVAMHPEIDGSRNASYQTPWIKKLAAQGMRFSEAYAPAPVCSPTRCSLQTGKSPAQLHWTTAGPSMTAAANHKLIPPVSVRNISANSITIAELLHEAGYATAHFGKWHLAGGGPGYHGYDEHDGNTGNEHASKFVDPNPVDIFGMAERAAEFMRESSEVGKPFFIQMSWCALHAPENALEATREKYERTRIGRNPRAAAKAAITEDLDSGVGRVMQAIDRLGISDNTFVVYMSDNGGGGRGNFGSLRGGKGSLWEGGIRVPLIVRGPGVAPNSWCHVPVVGYDFFPTFCEWAGIAAETLPERIEGGSIVSLLANGGTGEVERPREELVFHFPHYQSADGPHSAIILGDLKLLKFHEDGRHALFDLSRDIAEQNDLSQEQPDETARLLEILDAYLTAVDARMPVVNTQYDPERPSRVHQPGRHPPLSSSRQKQPWWRTKTRSPE